MTRSHPHTHTLGRMFRSIGWVRIVIDVVIAVAFFAVTAFATLSGSGIEDAGPFRFAAFAPLIALLMSAGLAVRRLSPALALMLVWLGAITQMSLTLPPLVCNFAILAVLYVTSAYGSRLVMWLGAASTVLGALAMFGYLWIITSIAAPEDYYDPTDGVFVMAVFGFFAFALAWTAGALVRALHRARDNREAQQIAEAIAQAEHERGRIARDLHDVVAHSLAVVVAQANGARYAGKVDPQIALDTLQTISQTAGSALADVRMLLAQLRHKEAEGPQPTIADLEELFARFRAAGVDLIVDIDPKPSGDVTAAVQLAVFRILQEALTNALRHAPGEPVRVTLAWHPGLVTVTIANPADGSGDTARDGLGHGIVGMRERATLVGGSLDITRDGGMFAVTARIPWEASA